MAVVVSEGAKDAVSRKVMIEVEIGMADFSPLDVFGNFQENQMVLRIWYPGFVEQHHIPYDKLMVARNNPQITTVARVVFNNVRQSRISRGSKRDDTLMLHADAMLGLELYAHTRNSSGQACVKFEGAFREARLRDLHLEGTTAAVHAQIFRDVRFISECLEGTNMPGGRSIDGIKAMVKQLSVRVTIRSGTVVFAPRGVYGSLAVRGFSDDAKNMLMASIRELCDFHNKVDLAAPKLRQYYSLNYKVAEGIMLPASAYMMHMMSPDATPLPAGVAQKMLRASLMTHTVFGSEGINAAHGVGSPVDEWVKYTQAFLAMPNGPGRERTLGEVSFLDCVDVAMAVLTEYPNSVPYILDMEVNLHGREKSYADMYDHLKSASGAPDTKLTAAVRKQLAAAIPESARVPVERFARMVMDTYGSDCEDFGMYEYWLKTQIQRNFLASPNLALRTLAQVFEMYVAFVPHMFCKGDDKNLAKDDGVYHHSMYMIPRKYMEACWMRGGARKNIFTKCVAGARAWESDYRQHLGVHIIEGTSAVSSVQFQLNTAHTNLRMENTQRSCTGLRNVRNDHVKSQIKVLHTWVSETPPMSGFFRWSLAGFCSESDRGDYLDFCWLDSRRRKGVRVEELAAMTDEPQLNVIIQYNPVLTGLCENVLEVYRQPYTGLVDVRELDEPALPEFVFHHSTVLRKLSAQPLPSSVAARRRCVVVYVQHLDFSACFKKRPSEIIKGLEEFAVGMQATALEVNAPVLGATWCSPTCMTETRTGVVHRAVNLSFVFYY